MASTSKFLPVAHGITVVGALGMRWCLQLAMDLGLQRLELETDCIRLVYAWQRVEVHKTYVDAIIKDCNASLLELPSVHVGYSMVKERLMV